MLGLGKEGCLECYKGEEAAASMNQLGCWPERGLPRQGGGWGVGDVGWAVESWTWGPLPRPQASRCPRGEEDVGVPPCEGQRLSTICKSSQ